MHLNTLSVRNAMFSQDILPVWQARAHCQVRKWLGACEGVGISSSCVTCQVLGETHLHEENQQSKTPLDMHFLTNIRKSNGTNTEKKHYVRKKIIGATENNHGRAFHQYSGEDL